MKRVLAPLMLCSLILSGCGLSSSSISSGAKTDNPQIGVNFIRFYSGLPDDKVKGEINTTEPLTQPNAIFSDFDALGVQSFRQLIKGDVLWNIIEPQEGEWHFTEADAVLMHANTEPIVALFANQYASGTPPWATKTSPFEKEVGADAKEYIETVVDRYKDYVKYWEIGNEMDHWRAGDAGSKNPGGTEKLPINKPADGFSPEEQGKFFKEVADIVRAHDPDAVIVMPGMSSLADYVLNTWLTGVIKGGGTDWFDVVNYHFYDSWDALVAQHQSLSTTLSTLGITDKPIWLTETGSTSSASLTSRTNYPNSESTEAADIFRRSVLAYAQGDKLVNWHTYIDSPDVTTNDWRGYGLVSSVGNKKPAYFAFQLLTNELIPFAKVERDVASTNGRYIYKVATESGEVKYVAWGTGNWTVPSQLTSMTSVVPSSNGNYTWAEVPRSLPLSSTPVLVK